MRYTLTLHHLQGAAVGYVVGVAVMFAIATKDLKKTHKDAERVMSFNQKTVDDVWAYLPGDVKSQLEADAKFYNISLREGL